MQPKKTPEDAREFAVAFEEHSPRQLSYGSDKKAKVKIKTEKSAVCAINSITEVCLRSGMWDSISKNRLVCKATKNNVDSAD